MAKGLMKLVKCATRTLKKAQRFALKHPIYKATSLFNGKIHFVKIVFPNLTVSDADVQTAVKYATLASKPISQYCSQYGPNSVVIDQTLYTLDAPNSNFSDANLQAWVETVSSKYSFPASDAVAVMNPPGASNTDAPLSQGVLGYHGNTGKHPYIFANMEGTGLTVDDKTDIYVDALSHEIAEMVVDPAADLSNPESNDPCSGNCSVNYRNYFGSDGSYLGGSPVQGYAFFTNGVATPATVAQCPSPMSGCVYDPANPPDNPQPNPPSPCISELQKGLDEILIGQITTGLEDILRGIVCLFTGGYLSKGDVENLEAKLRHARTGK